MAPRPTELPALLEQLDAAERFGRKKDTNALLEQLPHAEAELGRRRERYEAEVKAAVSCAVCSVRNLVDREEHAAQHVADLDELAAPMRELREVIDRAVDLLLKQHADRTTPAARRRRARLRSAPADGRGDRTMCQTRS